MSTKVDTIVYLIFIEKDKMSRSYKKTPWSGDKKGKFKKRTANKTVRTYLDNINHELKYSSYKKIFDSWDICDFGWKTSWNEYWYNLQKLYKEFPLYFPHGLNKKEAYRDWYKTYKMK